MRPAQRRRLHRTVPSKLSSVGPLMMMFMMGGMYGGHGGQDQTGGLGNPAADGHDHQPMAGRR